MTEAEVKYQQAKKHTTATEQDFMSNPTRKNYGWLIVLITLALVAGVGYYFYKH